MINRENKYWWVGKNSCLGILRLFLQLFENHCSSNSTTIHPSNNHSLTWAKLVDIFHNIFLPSKRKGRVKWADPNSKPIALQRPTATPIDIPTPNTPTHASHIYKNTSEFHVFANMCISVQNSVFEIFT